MTRHDIDCEQALQRLFDFLDHELAPDERQAMQRHLSICRGCYSRMEFERRLKERLRATREQEVDPATLRRFTDLLEKL